MAQLFIMLVGFSQSGKTTLAKKIQTEFSDKFIRIDSNSIHDFLNKNYPIFQDDQTVSGQSFELRQKTTKAIQQALIETLPLEGYSLILDACNLHKDKRKRILSKIKEINKDIVTIILQVQIPEEKFYQNLKKADQIKRAKGEKLVWLELYEKVQKKNFIEPQKGEADYFFTYTRGNLSEILDNLKNLLK